MIITAAVDVTVDAIRRRVYGPSDAAVADECRAAANCVQARGNPLMGVFRTSNINALQRLWRTPSDTETRRSCDSRVRQPRRAYYPGNGVNLG